MTQEQLTDTAAALDYADSQVDVWGDSRGWTDSDREDVRADIQAAYDTAEPWYALVSGPENAATFWRVLAKSASSWPNGSKLVAVFDSAAGVAPEVAANTAYDFTGMVQDDFEDVAVLSEEAQAIAGGAAKAATYPYAWAVAAGVTALGIGAYLL